MDQLRAAAGLAPLAGYLAGIPDEPQPMRMPCKGCGQTVEAWPPDIAETVTATCPNCKRQITIRGLA